MELSTGIWCIRIFFLVVFGLFKDEAAKKSTSTDHSREGTP